jgi:hypothetical protein
MEKPKFYTLRTGIFRKIIIKTLTLAVMTSLISALLKKMLEHLLCVDRHLLSSTKLLKNFSQKCLATTFSQELTIFAIQILIIHLVFGEYYYQILKPSTS